MRNNKFWDECSSFSIREAVATFIDNSPILSKFKDEKYYQLEDSIVEFIESQKEKIYREVDKEYQRDDVVSNITEEYGENATKALKHIPIEALDVLVEAWQDKLCDNELYWDATWDSLRDAIFADNNIFEGIDDLDRETLPLYIAYLKDWLESHSFPAEYPVCPAEFINNELADDEIRDYYEKLSKKILKEEDDD